MVSVQISRRSAVTWIFVLLCGGLVAAQPSCPADVSGRAAQDGPKQQVVERGNAAGGTAETREDQRSDRPARYPLHDTVRKGQIELTSKLLGAGRDVNELDPVGQTPLHLAAKEGNVAMAKLLLSRGAEIDRRDSHGLTPLHKIDSEKHLPVLEFFVSNGADVDAKDGIGYTLLQTAIGGDRTKTVNLLLKLGAQMDVFSACGLGQVDRVRSFLREDPNALHSRLGLPKSSPIHWAAICGQTEVLRLLLKSGANPNAKTLRGSTALLFASANGHLDAVRLLIAKGADVTARANPLGGVTPLHSAAYNGKVEVVKFLLDKGASTADMDSEGGTALHSAAQGGSANMAELLLRRGAAINAKTHRGLTPLDQAEGQRMKDALRSHGGKTGRELQGQKKEAKGGR